MGMVVGLWLDVHLQRQKCMAVNTQGVVQVSALGSSEVSAPQRFKCISIMGDSNRGSTTVRFRGSVLSREGLFSDSLTHHTRNKHRCGLRRY